MPPELPGLPSDAVTVPYQRFLHLGGPFGGPAARARLVIRNEDEWVEFLSQRVGPRLEPEGLAAPDFGQNMLLVAAMGQRPTAGYGISIEGVYESEGRLFVDVLEITPEPGCFLAQVVSAPVAAVLISRREGPVVFVEREEIRPCR